MIGNFSNRSEVDVEVTYFALDKLYLHEFQNWLCNTRNYCASEHLDHQLPPFCGESLSNLLVGNTVALLDFVMFTARHHAYPVFRLRPNIAMPLEYVPLRFLAVPRKRRLRHEAQWFGFIGQRGTERIFCFRV